MPFVAKRRDNTVVAAARARASDEHRCLECGERVVLRNAHRRQGELVRPHFRHPGSGERCSTGESEEHRWMKAMAYAAARERWPEATIEYLLVRPDNGKPWVFLSPTRHNQMNKSKMNDIWMNYFHSEYKFEDDDQYDRITSHFGRHRFTTYFRNERGWQEELIEYMLGHEGSYDGDTSDSQSLSTYVHTYYEDIQDKYLDEIYKSGLGI